MSQFNLDDTEASDSDADRVSDDEETVFVEKLIDEVKQRDFLYKDTAAGKKDTQKATLAWAKISQVLGVPGKDAKFTSTISIGDVL